jgi:hypothetical protein
MWRDACKKLKFKIHAVLLETPKLGNRPRCFNTLGTAFAIKGKPEPLFLTNAHVVCKDSGEIRNEKYLVLTAFLPGPSAVQSYIRILHLEKTLDIAVVRALSGKDDISPVTFAEPSILERGTAVASIGFPIPPRPELYQGGGGLHVVQRLATGFISQPSIKQHFPPAAKELEHYEINMLSYPGLSGAPVFNIEGLVIGMNRGSLLHKKNIAAYAYAIRAPEIIEFLQKNNIRVDIK